jgi:hypothetical protein
MAWSVAKIQQAFQNNSVVNAIFWAKGSIYASYFLLVTNWTVVHWLCLSVWSTSADEIVQPSDSSVQDMSLDWSIAGLMLAFVHVSPARRLLLSRMVFWCFHLAEIALTYTLTASIIVDPGVVKPQQLNRVLIDDEEEAEGEVEGICFSRSCVVLEKTFKIFSIFVVCEHCPSRTIKEKVKQTNHCKYCNHCVERLDHRKFFFVCLSSIKQIIHILYF